MSKEETITQAMGIPDGFTDDLNEILNRLKNKHESVSGLVLDVAEEVRESSLGGIEVPLSEYEKKLLMVGFFIGHHTGASSSNPLMSIIGKLIEDEDGKES
jgi:hypothetical protein